MVEAEDYFRQDSTEVRRWVRIDKSYDHVLEPDGDEPHFISAGGQAYLEALPDTRRTHDDPLTAGENFSNEPGRMALLHYRVRINNPGRYYVWVRAFSTGTEDNGLHVGLDGEWPESGRRMQWCEGKNRWTWASKQRTDEVHCGVEKQLFLDIETPGIHTISFSMREDGFEFDQWAMSREYKSPEGGTIFPQKEWLASSPEDQGVDSGKMQEALDYLEAHMHQNGIKELMIIRNGYVIHEGPQTDSVHGIWSCSKTFTSAVLGHLVGEGKLQMDDTAAYFEPLLREQYGNVTFRHFTTMTSGYSAEGDSRWPDADYADWSWTVYEPAEPLFPPGTAFAYWDEAQMMFGRALTQVLGQTMESYLKEKVTDRTGMEWSWGIEKEVNGIPINNGCTSVQLNAKNLARWGWLFMNNGRWEGEQLLNPGWVQAATSVQVPATIPVADTDRKDLVGPGCYGFNWWVNGTLADGTKKLPGAPAGTYFASGFNNNKCFVIPAWNMVVVRMGEDGNIDEADAVYGRFIEMLGEAIQ